MNKVISLFARNKSKVGFEALMAPHVDVLYRQALQYTGSDHDAEDLLQDLLVDLYKRRAALAEIESLRTYLSRTLYHRFVDQYRKKKHQPVVQDIDAPALQECIPASDNPDRNVFIDQIVACLGALSSAQRVTIALHDIEGHTLAEISLITEMPVGTLKSHLHRGRSALKKSLELQPSDLQIRL